MKKYNEIPLTHFIKRGIITALTILFACSNLLAAVLLEDNFNSLNSGDVNTDLSDRQSGSLADVSYQWWDGGNTPAVTNSGPYAGMAFWGNSTQVGLVQNFTESGNYSIEFDVIRASTNLGSAFSISIGRDNEWAVGPWHGPGMSLRFFGSGSYNMWINGTEFAHYPWFAELAATSNQILKIKLCVSQSGFPPESDQARVALFINDKAYPIGTDASTTKYIYNLTAGLTNNYIGINSFGNTAEAGTEIYIDNLKISTPDSNPPQTSSWSNDTDSGISNSKIYSHAVNLADVSTTINGVAFSGSPSNLMSGADWEIRKEDGGGYGNYNITDFGYAPNISGSSIALSTNILFDAVNSGCLTLSGLNTGNKYNLTIYSVGMDYGLGGPGTATTRYNYYATSDGGIISLLNQNQFGNNNGQILTYSYIASESGVFSISAAPTNNPLAWYAFSNEILPPDAPTSISASKGSYSDKILVSWSNVNEADSYTLYRADTSDISATNFAVVVITNVYNDTTVSQAQNYYYWVNAENGGGVTALTGPAKGFTYSPQSPAKPSNTSPVSFNTVTSPVTFSASIYSDPGSFSFAASQWQAASDDVFTDIIWESGSVIPSNIFTAAQNIIPDGTNYWRVRYMNEFNTWSSWSDDTSFICITNPAQSTIFVDTFNVSGNGDVNHGYANPGRQHGNAAPLTYKTSGTTETGNSSSHPGKLTLGENSGCSPNHSFIENSKFKIEFDAEPHNFDNSTDWLSCSFGKFDQSSFMPDSSGGIGAIFSANGNFGLYSSKTLVGISTNVLPTSGKYHVLISSSAESFENPVLISVFVNGIPVKIFEGFNKYYYEKSSGFAENFLSFFNYNSAGNNSSLVDNLSIKTAAWPFTISKWEDDTSSLIEAEKEYTHLVNLNGNDVTIEGQDFIGTGALTNDSFFGNGDPMITRTNWSIFSADGWTSFRSGNEVPSNQISGSSYELSEFYIFCGGGFGLTISDLLPYSSNTLYLYSKAIGQPDWGYDATFSSSYGNNITNINVDGYGMNFGSLVKCDYVADDNGIFTVAVTPNDPNIRYHISGFANEQIGVPEGGFYLLFIIYHLIFINWWRKSNRGFHHVD